MTKAQARRLREGQIIMYGDSQWTRDVDNWQFGRVLHVTANGGVKVRNADNSQQWVPYHFILKVTDEGEFIRAQKR